MSEVKNKRIAKFREADLYLVITKEFTAGRGTLRVLEEAADAGIRLVQLREKSITKKNCSTWRNSSAKSATAMILQ